MPRGAREKSATGIYHVILRGTNRQVIFHDDEDHLRFLETLAQYKRKADMVVYGWCLMHNHIHLLLREGKEPLSVTMKRIGVSFVWYYNTKYDATGHLFQDRYKSERVEQDGYLLTVLRYIHQNPVKAGLITLPSEWNWSSCREYYGQSGHPSDLLDKQVVLQLFAEDQSTAVNRFISFNEIKNDDLCMEDGTKVRVHDGLAQKEIEKLLGNTGIPQVRSLPKEERDRILHAVKGLKAVSQRQAARILGISPNLIFKA